MAGQAIETEFRELRSHNRLRHDAGLHRESTQSPIGRRRSALRSDCWRLSVSRRSTAPRVGRLGRRVRCGTAAASSRSASRSSAVARFRVCDRCSSTVRRTSLPRRAMTRSGSSAATRSQISSTRLAVVLTCWPPGPPDLLKRQVIAASGTRSPRGVTTAAEGTTGPGSMHVRVSVRRHHAPRRIGSREVTRTVAPFASHRTGTPDSEA